MNPDEKKYIEVFVDFYRNGEKAIPDDLECEYILKSRKIPDVYIREFKSYLRSKSHTKELEDIDAYDAWYDQLTYETMDPLDFDRYHLDNKKFRIDIGWEHTMMMQIYKIAKSFTTEAEKLALFDNNLYVGYEFSTRGVMVFFYSPKGVELNKICKKGTGPLKVQLNNLFNEHINKIEAILKNNKANAEKDGVILNSNTTRISVSKDIDKDGNEVNLEDEDYYCGRCFSITQYDITAPDDKYLIKLFGIIKDAHSSKRRPDLK